MIEIGNNIFISERELGFKFSKSSGPGGQNVNKVNTRVTVFFNVVENENLSNLQKKQILTKLATRIDKNGVIRIISQKHRTQRANRQAAIEKLADLLKQAIKKKTVRKKTKPSLAAKEKRLKKKKLRSDIKKQRARKIDME
ncbi:MAG: aminoacyl-tRNA hydrolase [Planctomycetes bacterium]|nr:aminoacyl-tRNA hydrolase [Planctomycetota bacterium]